MFPPSTLPPATVQPLFDPLSMSASVSPPSAPLFAAHNLVVAYQCYHTQILGLTSLSLSSIPHEPRRAVRGRVELQ